MNNEKNNICDFVKNVRENISGQLYYISICNTHDADDAYMDLYFSKDVSEDYFEHRRNFDDDELGTGLNFDEATKQYEVYYLAKNLLIEQGNTLILDEEDVIPYDNTQYSLYIKLSSGSSQADVIMKQDIKL